MDGITISKASQPAGLRAEFEKLLVWRCRQMHVSLTWPRSGWYRCRQCGRWYAVPWTTPERLPAHAPAKPVYGDLRAYARGGDPLPL